MQRQRSCRDAVRYSAAYFSEFEPTFTYCFPVYLAEKNWHTWRHWHLCHFAQEASVAAGCWVVGGESRLRHNRPKTLAFTRGLGKSGTLPPTGRVPLPFFPFSAGIEKPYDV